MKLYEEKYPTLHSEAYFNNRMTQYFDNFEIVYAKERKFPVKEGKKIPQAERADRLPEGSGPGRTRKRGIHPYRGRYDGYRHQTGYVFHPGAYRGAASGSDRRVSPDPGTV